MDSAKYNIKIDELESNYRNIQKVLHPDKFSLKSDEEKMLSMTGLSDIPVYIKNVSIIRLLQCTGFHS